jgi:hypothetical protein
VREAAVRLQDSVLVSAVDAARRTDRPDAVDFLILERFVTATRAHEIRIAHEVARGQQIHEQCGLVGVAINPPRIVLCCTPLTA